jgi:DNA-binding LacI/PurR family transcriptional regulator
MPKARKTVPTIADVARECGVGSMTVSRVMNGKKHVSVAMTKRVRAAIIKLGYEPNEAARILKGPFPIWQILFFQRAHMPFSNSPRSMVT